MEKIKKILAIVIFLVSANPSMAQYKPIDNGSSVKFTIKNFGINTGGSFTGLQGIILFDSTRLDIARFDISISAGSVNTGNEMRDNHLRETGYFDVKKYPVIRFVSTGVIRTNSGGLIIEGKLTIKDHTQNISFPFTATSTNDGYLFKGSFTINRKDFEVGGTSTISNNLEIKLNVLAQK